MNWQPIETAPREPNVEFLGWDGSIIDKTWVGWHDGTNDVFCHADWCSWKPTHWMPLPEPPKDG